MDEMFATLQRKKRINYPNDLRTRGCKLFKDLI